jgi:LacI family transcriptional regulator
MPVELPETRHFQLSKALRTEVVQRLKPTDPMPTQRELRSKYNVSQATLERSLAQLREEGLIYKPAGRQRLIRAEVCDPAVHRIAVIRPDYPSEVSEGITQSVVNAGRSRDWACEMVVYRHEDNLELNRAIGNYDAAVLLTNIDELPPHLVKALQNPHRPIVVVQRELDGAGVSSVTSDDREMARMAVQHLSALGHRKIACMVPRANPPRIQAAIAGWREALHAIGEAPDDRYLIDAATPPFKRSLDAGYRAFRNWINSPAGRECTAVYCTNTAMTYGAYRVVHEQALRIPEQFSIVGCDGISRMGEFFFPQLTATTFNLASYGIAVVDLLEEALNGSAETRALRQVRIPPTLIERDSSGPPPVG